MTVFLGDLDKKSDEELIAIKNGKIPFSISAKSTTTREDYMNQAEAILHKRQLSSIFRQISVNPGTVDRTSEKTGTWKNIEKEYGVSKRAFGKKINFVKDDFKRRVIFRDIEQAYFLAFNGFSKPAVILAGGVIEELLRLYLTDAKKMHMINSLGGLLKGL
jgi:DNA-binding Lrp family transcriptional regulator